MIKVKYILIIIGSISVVLGTIGVFLPLLPTTPFLLLAASCFIKSSDRLYQRLIDHKWFGKYIKDYRDGKGIPIQTKVIALFMLWGTILYSVVLIIPFVAIKVLLILIASTVTIHILRIKTKAS